MRDTKNAAPERIELPGGCYWHAYEAGPKGQGAIRGPMFPMGVMQCHREEAEKLAAAMQPVLSESDEAVARALHKAGLLYGCDPDEAMEKVSAILANHRQPAAQPVPHVEVSKTAQDLYESLNELEELGYLKQRLSKERQIEIIQSTLDAHALRAGELVREAAEEIADTWHDAGDRIRALDIATILKGDK